MAIFKTTLIDFIEPFLSQQMTFKYEKIFAKMPNQVWKLLKQKHKVMEELKYIHKDEYKISVVAKVIIEPVKKEIEEKEWWEFWK